jgi:ADP-ribosylglycohydrolase/uncharacterized protein (DUF1810 family)
MIGAIIGDTVGSVYEFKNIKTTKFKLFSPASNYTDDSVMTVAVADWLLKDREHNPQNLVDTMVRFANRFPCPMGGYGGNFDRWLFNPDTEYVEEKLEDGSTHEQLREVRKPYYSWGNGSAMRTSAVGWMFDTLEETERVAEIQASVTHNHPEGIKGAQATSAAIFMARTGKSKEEIKQYIETKYGYNLSQTCDDIRVNYAFDVSCQGTVPPAIIAFLDGVDFESCVRLAVSLGGDSDTLTCIAGGIAEAYYKDIPRLIVDEVWKRLPEEFKKILVQLHEYSHYNVIGYIPHNTTNRMDGDVRQKKLSFGTVSFGNILNKMLGSRRKPIFPSNDIERFVHAQADKKNGYEKALKEIRNGHKESHWIWYVFPQVRGLGHSAFSVYYSISDLKEAEEYLAHTVLGNRLREISNTLLLHKDKSITAIVSPHNAMKIRSCMTLFDIVSPNEVFKEVLDAFYEGRSDDMTRKIIEQIC